MCPLSGVEKFPLFGGFQCTNFNGRAIGTGNNVRYIDRPGGSNFKLVEPKGTRMLDNFMCFK